MEEGHDAAIIYLASTSVGIGIKVLLFLPNKGNLLTVTKLLPKGNSPLDILTSTDVSINTIMQWGRKSVIKQVMNHLYLWTT